MTFHGWLEVAEVIAITILAVASARRGGKVTALRHENENLRKRASSSDKEIVKLQDLLAQTLKVDDPKK